ncbi:solute carrier family 49 member 4 homolog [Palaemon carinicauda]|uniref:solute carrier family 49 member 4 homolog n=1 Tax=Palaemon carinicauda TaxID=392227 RepID=UPI0035B5F278
MPSVPDDMTAILPADHDLESSLMLASLEVKVYKRRWWILFLFAGLGFMQCAVWNTWGPITESVKIAYPSWSDAQIALLSMWGTITMILGLLPLTTLLQVKGIRIALLLTASFMTAGTALRCLTEEEQAFRILAHAGAILNGFAGIAIGAAPSMLSSRWFPPNERTTATGIGCTFNQLGNAGGFFLGPLLIRIPKNHTDPGNITLSYDLMETGNQTVSDIDDDDIQILRQGIRNYMFISASLCAALLIGVIAYFPNKPPKPPSLTSCISNPAPLMEDVKALVSNKNVWLLVIPYSITLGVNVAWSSVLDINVAPFGISQDEASMMGMYVTFGGVVMALIAARISDLLFGYMKLTIIFLMVIATGGFTWFLLIMNECLPYNKVHLFVSVIIGSSFNYACSPLFFELAVELAYPVSEGVVGGFLTLCWNVIGVIFLLTMQMPMESVLWMDYILAIQGLVVVLLMILVKEEYRRTSIDKVPETQTTENTSEA